MAAEKKTNGNTMKIAAGIAVIVILIAAAYFGGFFGKAAAQAPTPPASTTPQSQYASTKLLMASYDAGAALDGYGLAYAINDNGAITQYQLISNKTDAYARVDGEFGSLYGYFGAGNQSNIVCLDYANQSVCALVGKNDTSTTIANGLKALLPAQKAFTQQKSETAKLISMGAIIMDPTVTSENTAAFAARKISYRLDYSNLTVQQLSLLGVSPSDKGLQTTTGVTYWIDRNSGLMVKSHAAYTSGTSQGFFDTEYSVAQPVATVLPPRPTTAVATDAFIEFYKQAEQDYVGKAKCAAMSGAEGDACYKSLAVAGNSFTTCKKIANQSELERCAMIVAQNTQDSGICAQLSLYPDECYISVVGENGDASICKLLKNSSLGTDCISASTQGKQKQEQAQRLYQQQNSAHNCAANADCEIAGNSNQYCVPKNSGNYLNETSPLFSCLKNVPCGCNSGFCGFAKNKTYYDCVDAIEEQQFRAYIRELTNTTNTSSG